MAPTLLVSLACLVLWTIFALIRPIGLGIIHLLLVVGAVLWIRWWALRKAGVPK
jgi:hypothetical protein